MFEWDEIPDQFSFDDSDRFEEDSICSWISEPESVLNNWRGWRKQQPGGGGAAGPSAQWPAVAAHSSAASLSAAAAAAAAQQGLTSSASSSWHRLSDRADAAEGAALTKRDRVRSVLPLKELCASEVGASIPFELVESFRGHDDTSIPPELQVRIAYWSFPEEEEDIRLYSCLANGSSDEFAKGEHLFKTKAVKEPLQIGFHLSSTVSPAAPGKSSQNTSVTFDRRKIVSCQCSCSSQASWCAHVVALCLHRIHLPGSVRLRPPVSESLCQLEKNQLRKFAQYLITELPEQILPIAQNILDDLDRKLSDINTVQGAPDPTLGGAAGETAAFCLDARNLRDNIRKILVKFCVPAPIVFSDVNYLSTSAPPSASEWCSLLRPLRGREPEGMWNLLSIVREMYRRDDRNGIPLLEVVTQQCLETAQIIVWWFNTKVALQQKHHSRHNVNSNSQASQYACASLCDEVVTLWKLAALNPCISPRERDTLRRRLVEYHHTVVEKVQANQNTANGNIVPANNNRNNGNNSSQPRPGKPSDLELFPGFKPAIEACLLDWSDYTIPGVTYGLNSHYLSPFAVFKLRQDESHGQVNSSKAVLSGEYPRPRSSSHNNAAAAAAAVAAATEDEESAVASDEGVVNDQPPSLDNSNNNGDLLQQPPLSTQKSSDSAASSSNESKDEEKTSEDNGESSSAEDQQQQQQQQQQPAVDKKENEEEEDQFRVYYYDSKLPVRSSAQKPDSTSSTTPAAPDVFRNLRRAIDDPWEVLFMRAEGIHAHGYRDKACQIATHLAQHLLASAPDRFIRGSRGYHNSHQHHNNGGESGNKTEQTEGNAAAVASLAPPTNTGAISKNGGGGGNKLGHPGKKSVKAASHAATQAASTTLSHCAFLCTVLSESGDPAHRNLAFLSGMYGLELPRPPASSKPMEVKLAHQEAELVGLLKRIPLGHDEMRIIRERAQQLRDGTLKSRGEALLPLMLASYVFDCLTMQQQEQFAVGYHRSMSQNDEKLGFDAAVAAIGMKGNVSEADHPLLCEGTRRQRGDLALTLLTRYKDCPESVAKIMSRLLDVEVHPQFKSPILPNYYVCGGSSSANGQARVGQQQQQQMQFHPHVPQQQQQHHRHQNPQQHHLQMLHHQHNNQIHNLDLHMGNLSLEHQQPRPLMLGHGQPAGGGADEGLNWRQNRSSRRDNNGRAAAAAAQSAAGGRALSESGSSGNSSVGGDSADSSSSSSRRRPQQQQQQQGAAVDPRVPPEGAAAAVADPAHAANGAAIPRFNASNPLLDNWVASANQQHHQQQQQQPVPLAQPDVRGNQPHNRIPGLDPLFRPTLPNLKATRYKGKRQYPSIPNHPSEASAHFMFELAKTVLTKAGGTSSTSLFTQPTANQNHRGPHRALHMCAFQMGLYALGLQNSVSPNWLSRTYSSHVSWITGQAMELGAAALSFLIGTWEGHLTPPEAANMADKASKSRDAAMVRSGAALALSVLPHSAALNPNEIQRAIQQCKEQRDEMLEKACEAVEAAAAGAGAAAGGGVYPEVLFEVARHWYGLYEKHHQPEDGAAAAGVQRHRHQQQQQQQQHQDQQQQALLPALPQELAAMMNQPPNVLFSNAVAAAAAVQVSQAAGFGNQQQQQQQASLVGLPIPLYGILPNFNPLANSGNAQAVNNNGQQQPQQQQQMVAAAAAAGGAPLMFVTPPPPAAQAAAAQAAAALQLQAAAAVGQAQHGQAAARFGHLYPLGLAAPLLPAPPPTNPLQAAHAQQHAAAAAIAQQAAAFLANPPPPQQLQQQPAAAANATPPPQQQQQHQMAHPPGNNPQKYLLSAYRVGILAVDILGRRISDDRPQAKFAKVPGYAVDVKWLHDIAQMLGIPAVDNFLMYVLATIKSPFLLQELIWDCGLFLASTASGVPRSNVQTAAVLHQIRNYSYLNRLLYQCLLSYYQCLMQRLFHITPNDYDDFVSVLMAAKQTFLWAVDGVTQFHNMLHQIKRNKSCKRDLVQKIVVANQQCGNENPQPPPQN